ncbi:hypothetical protein [Bacillus sp. SJS]|uniref:hypothetical protein n=1 Tax=Bacillus sp. SJS TaxID=1423321 RepID=UPI0004DD5264|nr:hypothetical protein [Bacillus sp. SJS]KZZ84360.1 hypothetical protein AS29_010885 [Bacillus sp. SJS]
MKKLSIIMLIAIIILAACSTGGEPKDIKKVTITGNGLSLFSETNEHIEDREIVLEHQEDIKVIVKALKKSSSYSGATTADGENFKMSISYKDDSSDTILLWLYPKDHIGRFQKENYTGSVYLLNEEDIQSIAKLMNVKEVQ